jgi:hypothetical protein
VKEPRLSERAKRSVPNSVATAGRGPKAEANSADAIVE